MNCKKGINCNARLVYKLAKQPCNNLPYVYFLIDNPFLLIILKTCSKTEKPPNPNKKEQKIILVERFLTGVPATKLTPFVSSTIPEKKGLQNS